jgi:hypothetical protein
VMAAGTSTGKSTSNEYMMTVAMELNMIY